MNTKNLTPKIFYVIIKIKENKKEGLNYGDT